MYVYTYVYPGLSSVCHYCCFLCMGERNGFGWGCCKLPGASLYWFLFRVIAAAPKPPGKAYSQSPYEPFSE